MKVSREVKKEEAIKRMRAMNIYSDAIKQFKNADIVMVSEPPLGGLFWLNDEEKEMVSKFEIIRTSGKWKMRTSKTIMLLYMLSIMICQTSVSLVVLHGKVLVEEFLELSN